jgi:endonuclease I
MFKIKLFSAFIFTTFLIADIPPGYYDDAQGLDGEPLRLALHNIIDDHIPQSYSSLYGHFQSTDAKSDGTVWDMYSDVPGGTPPYIYNFTSADQCGNYSGEGDCFNREHSWPKSWFNEGMPMNTDLFHIYATDGYVNGMRSNHPYGEVESTTWTSQNGSQRGNMNSYNHNGTVFEPIDEYKGDFARTYFYMSTRYYTEDSGWDDNDMVNGSNLKDWAVAMLMDWHVQDSVSQKEIDRNNAVYDIQENRNPFIDHPEWVGCVWGECDSGVGNLPPIANAGPDQIVAENQLVTLDGSESYDDEEAPIDLSYIWTAPTGILLNDTTSPATSFTTPIVDDSVDFIFGLIVSDGELDSDPDSVTITVFHTNISPVANAGPDQTIMENELVILDGTGSSDFENVNLSYFWTAPVNIELDDPTRSSPTFISPEVSDSTFLFFTLIVSDGELESDPDSVTVTILNSLGFISNTFPVEFELRQPFPNPFNPTTTIQFNVPATDTRHVISLRVFDIAGSMVETLVNGTMKSGQYEIQWDASQHASGIYFLKMESGPSTEQGRGYIKKQKMILMK